jgi:hypothetical protein
LKEEEEVEEAMDEHAWLQQREEILRDIKEWRRVHPKATFVEIEEEVHQRMMQLEAQILQDAAQERSSREWGGTPREEHPRWPTCAVPLQARGKHKRTLQGNGGQSVTLQRT